MTRTESKRPVSATAQYLADMVRTLRTQAGWSQEELGARFHYTGAAISAVETCKNLPTEKMLAGLDEHLCGGSGMIRLAGRYLLLDRYPEHFQDYVPLEAAAVSISSYQTLVVDGLFQTEDYARAVLGCGFPPYGDEELEELVGARMDRSALFDRRPVPLLSLVLDESVLRRQIGSAEVMRGQLRYLAESARRRNVTVQVLPLSRGARGEHAGLEGPVILVETPDHEHVAYLETQGNSQLIRKPDEVSTLAQRYAMIRAQALGPDESLALIEELAGEQ
ncbi:helix-turn-helix transcriptional regulator [Streptomyces sp. A3M-1-3]|uniref:helix-turn-helix domain-containing protein n=1 Tax=Streptomyces sp. A3M-1-3 TaxID=2962044 RepID=UPI0020B80C7D|nr:helix-turn-helix transcriptional regulator [Streptomyces sp. A3M-1-3]MCP3816865.1 helix-turn-helix transcriptional regulator [Streptomyces sp. A3M-1-3]